MKFVSVNYNCRLVWRIVNVNTVVRGKEISRSEAGFCTFLLNKEVFICTRPLFQSGRKSLSRK